MRFLPLLLVAPLLLACSSESAPGAPTDAGADTPTDGASDAPADTAPPECGAAPRVSYSLNLGLLDSTGPHLTKGIKVRSSLCGAGVMTATDALGKATLFITKGTPQVLRFESSFSFPGIEGELALDSDSFLPGYMLLDSEATSVLPGYDAKLGTLWVQIEQADADGCAGKSGVTVAVPSAPGAQISYLKGYKATTDGATSDDGLVVVTKVPLGTSVTVTGAKTGCNYTTVARGYTGKFTTEAGAITYVNLWAVK